MDLVTRIREPSPPNAQKLLSRDKALTQQQIVPNENCDICINYHERYHNLLSENQEIKDELENLRTQMHNM